MKNSLVMSFSLDKENKKIKVEREFAAPLEKVWAAWTKASYSTNGGHQNPIRLKPNQWTSERVDAGLENLDDLLNHKLY